MYSFHSSPEEKHKLLYALAQHGIETTVDRVAKKKRIRDWIQESVIQEDEEEDDSSSVPTNLIVRSPVAGHVSSVRAAEKAEKVEKTPKQIVTTVKDAANKHRDPRTGEIQQGPSEMGTHSCNKQYTNGHKLVDAGSQTTIEAPRLMEDANEHMNNRTPSAAPMTHPRLSANRRQNSAPEPLSTSRGLIAAFNSVATITMPETSGQHNPSYQINDSGYGSLDKLKPMEHGAGLASPIFTRRDGRAAYGGRVERQPQNNVNAANAVRRDKDRSPFESDSGGDVSPYGSSPFVNQSSNGFITRSTIITSTMKDTPYDNIKPRRNKFW